MKASLLALLIPCVMLGGCQRNTPTPPPANPAPTNTSPAPAPAASPAA